MIYVDASVVLAQLLAEDLYPDPSFWQDGPFVSSRLLEYETWTRINARGLSQSHGDDVRLLFAKVSFLELAPRVLARALEPFPSRFERSMHSISRRSTSCGEWASARFWPHKTGVCRRQRPRSK